MFPLCLQLSLDGTSRLLFPIFATEFIKLMMTKGQETGVIESVNLLTSLLFKLPEAVPVEEEVNETSQTPNRDDVAASSVLIAD